jgi:hypothetical protein
MMGKKWMVLYRYMFMDMDGNRDGTRRLNESNVFAKGFMVAPTLMTMQMHMAGVMYRHSNDLTLMAMLPYRLLSMDHVTMSGVRFTTQSDGIGDGRLMGRYVLHRWKGQQLRFDAGVSFPTGSTNEKDDMPTGPNQKLPYPMQLGSGTFDLLPGIAYMGQTGAWSWGTQLGGTLRLGRNSEGYSLGEQLAVAVWGTRRWTNWLGTSLRFDGQKEGNIDGQDNDLNPRLVPTADPNRRARERVDVSLLVDLFGSKGLVQGHRLTAEVRRPIYQFLDGPQLETDWIFAVAWRLAF